MKRRRRRWPVRSVAVRCKAAAAPAAAPITAPAAFPDDNVTIDCLNLNHVQ